MSSPRPLFYSVPKAAKLLTISTRSAWRRVADGTLPTIQIGHRRLVPSSAIDRLAGSAKRPAPIGSEPREPKPHYYHDFGFIEG
jgi:hypothetical protein